MTKKKANLFDTTGKEAPKPKKPTLLQYLKESPVDSYPQYHRIEQVWFPGNWENYSIETIEFRASIAPSHTLFDVVDTSLAKALANAESALLLVLLDLEGTIGFSESNFYGKYTRIGNAGYRFQPTDGAN